MAGAGSSGKSGGKNGVPRQLCICATVMMVVCYLHSAIYLSTRAHTSTLSVTNSGGGGGGVGAATGSLELFPQVLTSNSDSQALEMLIEMDSHLTSAANTADHKEVRNATSILSSGARPQSCDK